MDILSLLDQLEHLITSSRRMPMTNRVLLGEQEVLQLIDQMRSAVPEEVKQARRLHQERDRVLAQAQVEASRIIEAANEEAERLINDEEMMQLASERAAEIEREAEEEARQLRDGADAYVAETLRGLEDQLSTLQTQIDQTVLSIRKGLETLTERAEASEESEEGDEEEPEEEEDQEKEAKRSQREGVARTVPKRALYDTPPVQSSGRIRAASAPVMPVPPGNASQLEEPRSGWRRRR